MPKINSATGIICKALLVILHFPKSIFVEMLNEFIFSQTTRIDKVIGAILVLLIIFFGTVVPGSLVLIWASYWNEPGFYMFTNVVIIMLSPVIYAPWLMDNDPNGKMTIEALSGLKRALVFTGIYIFLTSFIIALDPRFQKMALVMFAASFVYMLISLFVHANHKDRILADQQCQTGPNTQ